MIRPLLIAIQFLTRIPVRLARAPEPAEIGRSVLAYPIVGLLIAAALALVARLLAGAPPGPLAALLLLLWVGLTGALHLDGLADCADGWIGGRGDRERTLRIMKDPRAGPAAVAAVGVVLIVKYAALQSLLASQTYAGLLLAPLLARAALPVLLAAGPLAGGSTLARMAGEALPRTGALAASGLAALAAVAVGHVIGLAALAVVAAVSALLRQAAVRNLGGVNGDVCGAVVELSETLVLLAAALAADRV